MLYLTYPQRLILEIIHREKVSINQLQKVSGLNRALLDQVVSDFLAKGLVTQTDQGFLRFAKNLSKDIKNLLLNKENLQAETTDMIGECLVERLYNEDQKAFNCKKVSMTEKEYKLYRGMIFNIQSFLEDIEKRPFIQKHNQIIYWGERSYEATITNAFNI